MMEADHDLGLVFPVLGLLAIGGFFMRGAASGDGMLFAINGVVPMAAFLTLVGAGSGR